MNEQETVDRLALLAEPRFSSLLRLRSVKHVYDPTPGALNASSVEGGHNVILNKLHRTSQPYHDIRRFVGDDKVMQYIVDPGLLPIVTALSKDIAGRKLLVTRRLAPRNEDKGVIGHLRHFGLKIMVYFDDVAAETIVEWSCLYGVV